MPMVSGAFYRSGQERADLLGRGFRKTVHAEIDTSAILKINDSALNMFRWYRARPVVAVGNLNRFGRGLRQNGV